MIQGTCTSLAHCLRDRAASEPERVAYIFVGMDGVEQQITCAQLYADALAYAQALRSLEVQPGDLVLLVFDHSDEVIAAFWGAIHLGAVPTIFPYFMADPLPEVYRKPLSALTEFTDAKAILTSPEFAPALDRWVSETRCLVASKPSEVTDATPQHEGSSRGGEDIAYVQLTTGSSGPAKGALLSHRAILHRMAAFSTAFNLHSGDRVVCWWSFNQSAAINCSVVPPVVVGCTAVNIPPQQWARHPQTFLQTLHRFRGVASMMPNSGLNHCVRNVRDHDLSGVDLHSWRVLGVAGEMVQHESLQAFTQRFAPYGFAATALKPYYACAECSFIAVPGANDLPHLDWLSRADLDAHQQAVVLPPQAAGAKAVVSCGRPIPGVEVAIVDEAGRPLPERHVGEIIVRSPGLFSGYYRRSDLTEQALRAGWFYTGDLGYLAEGQLYPCDRKKDVIIVGGRNIYAVDIELTAEKMLGETGGRAVAFGVPDVTLGTERPVLVAEVDKDMNESHRVQLVRQLRRQVFQAHDVALADVRLVDSGWIVTTPKLSRTANRQKYLACGFGPPVSPIHSNGREGQAASQTPAEFSRSDLERILTELFEGALGMQPVGREENFFELGGDSLVFVHLLATLEDRLGHSLPVDELVERPTIAAMLDTLAHPSTALAPPVTVYHDHLDPLSVMRQVSRDPHLSVSEKVRRLFDLLYIRLTYTGPRFFDYTLPYAIGTQVLEWVCRQSGITRLIFRQRASMVRQGLAALNPASEADAFRQSLRTHLWMYWRLAALARCPRAEFDRWVTVSGLDTLHRALQQGRGVVLVMSHLAPLFVSPLVLGRLNLDNFMVVGARLPFAALLDLMGLSHLKERHHFAVTNHDRRRANQLLTGQQWLRQGNVVLISGDGYQGKLPFLLPFCGQRRHFGVGFAELAVRTGATVIPIFHALTPGGHIKVEFLTPLEANGETHQDNVSALVRQYAALLEQRWLSDPGSVHIDQLNRFLDSPLAT